MKRTISIILVMVMVLTMTACVKSDAQVATSEAAIVATVEPTYVETTISTEAKHKCKIEYLHYDEDEIDQPLLEMSSEEISDYLAEMVHISQTETLCWSCMNRIGANFYVIWKLNKNKSVYNKDEFEAQAIVAFDNVLAQAAEQQIPIEFYNSWERLPIVEVLCKYYSNTNLSSWYETGFVDELSEEELTEVAKVFFANPVFSTNYWLAKEILIVYSNNELADMAWNHLLSLSKSSDDTLSQGTTTYFTCLHIFGYPELLANTDKVTEIAENILQNSHYNFVAKYVFLCSDFCSKSDLDTIICDMAFNSLLETAENADEETYELVVDVAVKLYEKYELDSTAVDKLHGKYDVDLLENYLTDWKEVANTKLPSWY